MESKVRVDKYVDVEKDVRSAVLLVLHAPLHCVADLQLVCTRKCTSTPMQPLPPRPQKKEKTFSKNSGKNLAYTPRIESMVYGLWTTYA